MNGGVRDGTSQLEQDGEMHKKLQSFHSCDELVTYIGDCHRLASGILAVANNVRSAILGEHWFALKLFAPEILEKYEKKHLNDECMSPAFVLDCILENIERVDKIKNSVRAAVSEIDAEADSETGDIDSEDLQDAYEVVALLGKLKRPEMACQPVFVRYFLRKFRDVIKCRSDSYESGSAEENFSEFNNRLNLLLYDNVPCSQIPEEERQRVVLDDILGGGGRDCATFEGCWIADFYDAYRKARKDTEESGGVSPFSVARMEAARDCAIEQNKVKNALNSSSPLKAPFLNILDEAKSSLEDSIWMIEQYSDYGVSAHLADKLVSKIVDLAPLIKDPDIGEEMFLEIVKELSFAERWILENDPGSVMKAFRERFPQFCGADGKSKLPDDFPKVHIDFRVLEWFFDKLKLMYVAGGAS